MVNAKVCYDDGCSGRFEEVFPDVTTAIVVGECSEFVSSD